MFDFSFFSWQTRANHDLVPSGVINHGKLETSLFSSMIFFHFNAHLQGIVHILGRHSHILPMFSRRVKFQVPAGGEEQDDRVQELGDE